jgi:type IV pilus assembly protein PilW
MTSLNLGRARGFSVVELMVSVVIGLLALMFATRLLTGAESNKQAALGGSDSMQNGMMAMFSISGDAAQAGFGLNDPLIAGCNTLFADTGGYALAQALRGAASVTPLGAAVIESNGANPDRLTLYSGSSISGTGTLRVTTDYAAGTRLDVDRVPYGFAAGDVIVVASDKPGGNCALAQISSDLAALPPPPAQQFISFAGGQHRFNSGALGGATFKGGVARVFNLGPQAGLAFHSWSVADGFLQLRSTDMAGAATTPATVADNIVSIKAQYGLDTRVGANFLPEEGMQVGSWTATMLDADSDGVIGSAGDYQRIAALRIAVVARSKAPERAAPGAAVCSATTVQPVVFATGGPGSVAAVPVTVNVAVTGDRVDWRCYRYRVFETIVPLRNAGWRPSA